MNSKRLIVTVLVIVAIVGYFVFFSPEDEERPTIVISDNQNQSLWINNALASFIIEHGYDYPVEIVEVSTGVMWQSLGTGDVHVQLELWRFNALELYNDLIESGDLIDLGSIYERASQGWYVPRYLVEGDPERGIEAMAPGLRSVHDLADYVHLFPDPENPEMGAMVNCIIGWDCMEINNVKLHAYGLADDYNMIEVGSSAAMDSVITSAYQHGEPILTYYWEPTALMGALDFIQLEEPAYSEECDAEIQRVRDGEIAITETSELAGCAYLEHAVHTGVHRSFPDFAPEVVEFLRNMNVGTDPLNEALAYMIAEEAEADEVAMWYMENFQERWRSWIPSDIEEKVENALREAGANI